MKANTDVREKILDSRKNLGRGPEGGNGINVLSAIGSKRGMKTGKGTGRGKIKNVFFWIFSRKGKKNQSSATQRIDKVDLKNSIEGEEQSYSW